LERQPIVVDGSMGEGGGQILRTAIALSAATGVPVRVVNIRAKRSNPGLRPQHLTAIRALAAISGAKVKGARVGSTEVEFWPGRPRGGYYEFDVGTAGSVSLVLQALLPALAYADSPVKLRIRGGTDVRMAPLIDYVREVLTRLLERFGYHVTVRVLKRGHYPKGGGLVEVEIPDPPRRLRAASFVERGGLRGVRGRSHAVRLPRHVAERQAKAAAELIESALGVRPEIEVEYYERGRDPHLGPGSGIVLWATFDNSVMGGDALGERGKPAERVGVEAASKLVEDVNTGAAIDRYASDMLPVYMVLAEGVSEYTGARLTSHARTVFDLLRLFFPEAEIGVEGSPEAPFKARIRGIGLRV